MNLRRLWLVENLERNTKTWWRSWKLTNISNKNSKIKKISKLIFQMLFWHLWRNLVWKYFRYDFRSDFRYDFRSEFWSFIKQNKPLVPRASRNMSDASMWVGTKIETDRSLNRTESRRLSRWSSRVDEIIEKLENNQSQVQRRTTIIRRPSNELSLKEAWFLILIFHTQEIDSLGFPTHRIVPK